MRWNATAGRSHEPIPAAEANSTRHVNGKRAEIRQ